MTLKTTSGETDGSARPYPGQNNFRRKDKRIQCKHVQALTILQHVLNCESDPVTSVDAIDALARLATPKSIRPLIHPIVPTCVLNRKIRNLTKKGLLESVGPHQGQRLVCTVKGYTELAELYKNQHAFRASLTYVLESLTDPQAVMLLYVVAANMALAKGQTLEVDTFLSMVDFSRVPSRLGAMLLRNVAPHAAFLSSFQAAKERYVKHYTEAELDQDVES